MTNPISASATHSEPSKENKRKSSHTSLKEPTNLIIKRKSIEKIVQKMEDMCSGSTSAPSTQDEISLFLRQFLLRSSSSAPTHMGYNENALLQDAILAVDSSTTRNETDEYDFESEEGEALAEEIPPKLVPSRSSSKRSRAAEVHNLSEKRRRSRINEKLKALKNLIPNSNKTDKASMLDEAIEYLKQLQLQVQMLSMRNGLSMHPMLIPEGLQPLQLSRMRTELGEKNRSIPSNMTATLPLNQANPLHYSSNLPNKCTVADQRSVLDPSYIIKAETSFGLESPIPAHIRSFQPRRSSEISREDTLQYQQLNTNHSDTNPLGGCQGTLATTSLSFDLQTSAVTDNSILETCITGRDQSGMILRNSEPNVILTSLLSR